MCEVQNKVQNASENVNKDKMPETLYHYCGLDTFYNIVKNKSIWLSDLSKTNDSQELIWLKNDICEKLLPMIKEEQKKSNQDDFLGWEFVKQFLEERVKTLEILCWGFCLSIKSDDLNQWRGYGDNGAGISIGFSYDKLMKMIPSKSSITIGKADLNLNQVKYGIDTKLYEDIKKIAEEKHEEIEKIVNDSLGDNQIHLSRDVKEAIVKEMAAMTRFPFYKTEAFKEEAEWRIVFAASKDKEPKEVFSEACKKIREKGLKEIDRLKFKNYEYSLRNNMLVSHLEIEFENMEDIIQSITIGPKAKVAETDIVEFLKLNYGSESNKSMERIQEIEVKKSAIPYR